jgi:Zn-dependent peptidase ImmA (M78 family)/transcriptional regulator with XRE-family HTH domain
MNKTFEVPVKPDVLKWARETIGKTPVETAKRLGVSEETIRKWETGERRPTLRQLRLMTKYYKRPLAVFFLPSAPQEQPLPVDFRSLSTDVKKPFSEKTLLALRRARRLQRLIGELAAEGGRERTGFLGKANLSENTQILAKDTRKRLGITVETQFKWLDETVALSLWRKTVEKLNLYIFELPFPLKEGRAFSLYDKVNPAIVLNSNDAVAGRIFSLFHEYAHLLLGEGAICDLSEENKSIEQFCNRFAGEFLVPSGDLIGHPISKGHSNSPIWTDEELQQIARAFKVSREVILRRLLLLRRTTDRFYNEKTKEWETKRKPVKRGGRRIPSRQCLRQNGRPFVSLVLESAKSNTITHRDVSDYLNISLKHLPQVESMIREESGRYA